MAIVRVIWPLGFWDPGEKVLGIFDTSAGYPAVNQAASYLTEEDWDNIVAASGSEEQAIVDLGITEVRDMR